MTILLGLPILAILVILYIVAVDSNRQGFFVNAISILFFGFIILTLADKIGTAILAVFKQ